MNKIGKIALITFSLLILIIGISCASAANVDHGSTDSLHIKNQQAKVKITQNVKKLPAKKAVATKASAKKSAINKKAVTKKASAKKVAVNKKAVTKKASAKKATVNKKAVTKKSVANKKTSVRPVDKVINGWNPKDHEVSRKYIGDGQYRVTYDDGYHRIIDRQGNILSYGY